MTFTLAQHKAWCVDPKGDADELIAEGGWCVGIIRRSWGQLSWGGSAKIWWDDVPDNEKHFSDIRDVPEGAALYLQIGEFDHCFTAAADLEAWTIDYNGRGTWGLAPMALPRWSGRRDKVWWTSWAQYGRLPVGKTYRQLHPPTPPKPPVPKPPASAGVPVKLSNLKYGLSNDDVKDLQRQLNKTHGFKLPITGNYRDQTDAAVRHCQRVHNFGLDPKKHSFVGRKQALHLGLKPV